MGNTQIGVTLHPFSYEKEAIGILAIGLSAIGHSAIGISAININWQSSIIIGVIFLCVSFQFTTSP